MNLLDKLRHPEGVSAAQTSTSAHNNCCEITELNDFIKKFVTIESLEPAVNAFTSQHQHCGCHEHDGEDITILDHNHHQLFQSPKNALPELEVLLAGHRAWCNEVEQMMRQGKTSEFNLNTVGEELMCCIGKWLNCECDNMGLRHYSEYIELVHSYKNLQICAENMLEHHQRGHLMEAILMLRNEFTQKSEQVQEALFDLVAVLVDDKRKHMMSAALA